MDLSHLLKFCFYWLATIAGTGNVPIVFDGDVVDALAGETFVVKTWADTRQLKSITVVKGNVVQLTAFFMESNIQTVQYQHGVILPQYNTATREMSLVLTNCSKKHEDIYSVNETVDDTSPNNFEREVGIWNFKLNVIEPSEVKECDVGGIFKMEIREWSRLRYLFYYDQIVVHDLMICIVATDSHLHGRLRCGIDSINIYVIIIQNVTQKDIGLYTVANTIESKKNDSTRYYLNVTDRTRDSSSTRGPAVVPSSSILDTEKYTTSPSLIVRLTSPDNPIITYDDANTARTGNSHTFQTPSMLFDVKYVVIGAMGLISMMIGCFIWIQRRNRHSLKRVQRLVFETSSSTLNSAPSSKRKHLQTSIVDEEGLCRLIRSTPVGKAQSVLKFRSNPDNSLSFDTQSSFAMSLPILEDDKPGLTCKNIVASKESNKISIQMLSYARDNTILEDCPTVCVLGSAASNAAVDQSQPDQFPYYPYAKVKKGPRSIFTNNMPDGEGSDGYKMVNFTRGNDQRNTFQSLEIVSKSTIPVNVSFQENDTNKNNYVRDAKDDDGYETCGNIEHMTFIEHTKVYEDEDAMTDKDQEPKNCMIPHCAMHSDYADIDI